MTRYVAELERSVLEDIARDGIRRVRRDGYKVPRDLGREIKEVATTTRSFALGTYGRANTCRCLIGEVRFRRGENPMPPAGFLNDLPPADPLRVQEVLAEVYDELVHDRVGRLGGNVRIV